MKIFLRYWFPVLLWAGFIFFISSLTASDVPRLFPGQDILFHIFEYALLALLLNRALKNSKASLSYGRKRVVWVILACLIYAISDEFHQGFVPGRISSVNDVIIDGLGSILGSVIYR